MDPASGTRGGLGRGSSRSGRSIARALPAQRPVGEGNYGRGKVVGRLKRREGKPETSNLKKDVFLPKPKRLVARRHSPSPLPSPRGRRWITFAFPEMETPAPRPAFQALFSEGSSAFERQ